MKKLTLYKFCSLSTKRKISHVLRIITNRQLYFSDPRYFNDPYDCQIAEYLDKYLQPYGVLCLSTIKCNMILMFAHYADCHRGLCLQFEIDEDYYLGDPPAPFVGEEVKYYDEMPRLPDDPNSAHWSYLTKYNAWCYEKEYRVVWNLKKLPSSRLVEYKDGQLRGVIFGLRMCSQDESMVRDWFLKSGHQNIFFKKVQPCDSSFRLMFIDA